MRHLILSTLLIFSSSLVYAQEGGFTNKREARNKVVNGLKEGKWIEYLNGDGVTADSNKASFYRLTQYKADKPMGMVRIYYLLNGKIESEEPYVNGKENGVEKQYYETGEVQFVRTYTDDKENGVEVEYDQGGKVISEVPYVNDTVNGTIKEYYATGTVKTEMPHIKGKANGMSKGYYESGKLKWEKPYSNNFENGVEKQYYEDGKLKAEAIFIYGHNKVTHNYDESGNQI